MKVTAYAKTGWGRDRLWIPVTAHLLEARADGKTKMQAEEKALWQHEVPKGVYRATWEGRRFESPAYTTTVMDETPSNLTVEKILAAKKILDANPDREFKARIYGKFHEGHPRAAERVLRAREERARMGQRVRFSRTAHEVAERIHREEFTRLVSKSLAKDLKKILREREDGGKR